MKLNLNDMARCLDLPVSTVDRWIRQGRIPIHRSGNGCIFKESILEKWAFNHGLRFSLPNEERKKEQNFGLTNLLPAMQLGGVFHDIKGDDVESVLKSAVDKVPIPAINKEGLYERLLEREALTSTGIGKGVAIPHPRTHMGKGAFLETPCIDLRRRVRSTDATAEIIAKPIQATISK